jgi:hypothetical protein
MTTINDLRQQIENEYVEPVTEQTPVTFLVEDINSTTLTFKIVPDILSPDETSLIGPGSLLEVDSELVRVLTFDESIGEIECRRGQRGTTKAAHTEADSTVRFPTRWIRSSIEKAISASIVSLWKPLYVVKETITTVGTASFVALPLNTVRLVNVEYRDSNAEWQPVTAELFETHPTDPTRASVQLGKLPSMSTLCVIRYGVRIEVPADTTTDIEDLPQHWERIIASDVGAQLLASVDIDAQTQEVLTQQLRLERFPVKSGTSISQSLIRYKEYLVGEAVKEIESAHPVKVRQLTNLPWG